MTTITHLDADTALELLKRAVNEVGADHVDSNALNGDGCVNFNRDGSPCCIVGHVLNYLGVEPFGFDSSANRAGVASIPSFVRNHIEFDFDAISVLETAQDAQDGGNTWGDAYQEATDCLIDLTTVDDDEEFDL